MKDLGKIIVAKGFEKLPKVLQITQSGHTVPEPASNKFQGLLFLMQMNNNLLTN